MADSESNPSPTPVSRKAAPAEAAKKTIEEWATAKKFLPQVIPQPDRPAPAATARFGGAMILGTPEKHNPEFWKFAAARAANGWPVGFEITEADFDAEIQKHTTLAHG